MYYKNKIHKTTKVMASLRILIIILKRFQSCFIHILANRTRAKFEVKNKLFRALSRIFFFRNLTCLVLWKMFAHKTFPPSRFSQSFHLYFQPLSFCPPYPSPFAPNTISSQVLSPPIFLGQGKVQVASCKLRVAKANFISQHILTIIFNT